MPGVTDNLYPSLPNVLSAELKRTSFIKLLPAALFVTAILNPAGVATAVERKLATLFASASEEATAITDLLVTLNDPAFETTETGKGMIETVDVCADRIKQKTNN